MIFVVILLGIVIGIGVTIATFIFKMNKEMEVIKKYSNDLDVQIEKINEK
jgi:MFS superfamily sulfate permease-like transporter